MQFNLYIYIGCAVVLIALVVLARSFWGEKVSVQYLTKNYHFPLTYAMQVREELVKCTWPWDPNLDPLNPRKYRQLTEATVVVIVLTVMMAGLISVADILIHPAVGFLTNTESK
jgi:preprotein translocase subunit SecE